jgi:carbon monoxide dehydrogenase subunit G
MLLRPVVALWGLWCFVGSAASVAIAADDGRADTAVTVSRSGPVFEVEALSRVDADLATAWAVLTDYAGYVDFVPGMTLSRRVGEQPLLIEQRGEFGLLFFSKQVEAVLEVIEKPPSKLYFRSLEGNLRRLETSIDIRSEAGQVVITYRSVIEPDFWVPPIIGTPIVRAAIRRKLGAVAEEIERRANSAVKQ